nr:hypothetical protein [Tanacetum cinerariifolium]
MGDMRREMGDMQAKLLALREQPRRARQPGGDARVPNHQDAPRDADSDPPKEEIYCDLHLGLVQDAYFLPSDCLFGTSPDLTKFVADETEKINKYVSGIPDNIYESVKASKPKTLDETIELANDLMDQKFHTYEERQTNNKRKADDSIRNNHGHQQQTPKRQNVTRVYNIGTGEKKPYSGNLPKSPGNANVANAQRNNEANPKGNGCFKYGAPGHFKRDYPKLKNKDGGKVNAPGWVYAVGNAEKRGNASRDPNSNFVTGTK